MNHPSRLKRELRILDEIGKHERALEELWAELRALDAETDEDLREEAAHEAAKREREERG